PGDRRREGLSRGEGSRVDQGLAPRGAHPAARRCPNTEIFFGALVLPRYTKNCCTDLLRFKNFDPPPDQKRLHYEIVIWLVAGAEPHEKVSAAAPVGASDGMVMSQKTSPSPVE